MALLTVPIYEFSWKQTYLGKVLYNVAHWIQDNSDAVKADATVDLDIVTQALALWTDNFIPLQNAALTFNGVTLRVAETFVGTNLDTDPVTRHNRLIYVRESFAEAEATVGGVTGDAVNSFTATRAFKRSIQFGRKMRGSMHVAGLTESQIVGQTLGTAATTDWNNAFIVFLLTNFTSFVGGGSYLFRPCIWSTTRFLRNDPGTFDIGALDVAYTSFVTFNNRLGSMTRRKARG